MEESNKLEETLDEKENLQQPEEPLKHTTFDDVLLKLGQFGRYQKRVYFLLFIPTIFSGMHKLAWVFLGAKADHRCRLPNEPDDTMYNASGISGLIPWDETDGKWAQCRRYDGNGTEMPCDAGWVYDTSTFGSSAVMEWNLVCGSAGMRATAQSLFMVGVMIGSYVFGDLSDRWGRKPTFFASVILQSIFGFIAGLVPEYWSFVLVRMVIGMTTSGVFLVSYVIGMEMVGPKYRVIAGTLCQYYYTFGFFYMPLVAYFLNGNWQVLQIVLTCPTVLFISYWWIVPESVRWQISKGKFDEAKDQIRRVAEENKVEVSEELIEEMIETTKQENQKEINKQKHSILDLVRFPNLRKKSMVIFFNWFVCSGTYYGLSLNASDLGGNPYINFLLAAAVEIPAYAFNLLVLNNPKVGRRLCLCGCMLLAGVVLTITIFVPKEQTALIITLTMAGKLAITSAYGVIYIFTAELYPTVVRNVGMGASSMCARIGGIICPFINMLVDVWKPLPLIIYGVLAFVGGSFSLFLPETLNKELPETIEDGEEFGKNAVCCRTHPKSNSSE